MAGPEMEAAAFKDEKEASEPRVAPRRKLARKTRTSALQVCGLCQWPGAWKWTLPQSFP